MLFKASFIGLCRASVVPALVFALPIAAHAAIVTIVPGDPGNAQSPTPFNYYGNSGSRTQQVYASDLFGNFGGARSISEFDFRSYPGATPNGFIGNTVNISDVMIALSTTQSGDEAGNTLSTTYASNIGADVQTVYSGALILTTLQPGAFDYRIVLQNAFTYNPALGNLLLDVTIPAGAIVSGPGFGFLTFDTVNTLNDGIFSIVNINTGGSSTGTASTAGTITQFISDPINTPVAEPVSVSILAMGLVGLVLVRKRTQPTGYLLPIQRSHDR